MIAVRCLGVPGIMPLPVSKERTVGSEGGTECETIAPTETLGVFVMGVFYMYTGGIVE